MKFIKTTILTVAMLLGATSFALAQNHGDKPGDLPDNVDTSDCTAKPPFKSFDIQVKWKSKKYTGQEDPYTHGRSTPLVGDVDGDGEIEIVVPGTNKDPNKMGDNGFSKRPNTFIARNLNVLNGKTGELKYVIKTCDFQIHGQPITMADVNNDGKYEIFILSIGPRTSSTEQTYSERYLHCYDGSKANANKDDVIWKDKNDLEYCYIPMIADVDNDGIAELVCGPNVFNTITGKRILAGATAIDINGMGFGGPHNVHGGWQQSKQIQLGEQFYLNALADIDGDGDMELCAGNTVYDITITNHDGASGNKLKKKIQCETNVLPFEDMYDGQTFVLDFDNDGDLDVCVLGRNKNITNFGGSVNHVGLYVWEGQSSEVIGYFVCDPKTNSPSIPFAGDLDGDGFPEVIFNGWVYGTNYGAANNPDQMHVFKYSKGYKQDNFNTTGGGKAINIKEPFTRAQCQEFFESAGFTVFDFNQDGKTEIVFRGEKNLYILDGTTLAKLCTPISATSGTTAEYPVVADVDMDGHADIIYTEEYDVSMGPAGGCTVCESKTFGAWGPARKIWNQWPYNVVNINEDGTVPKYQFSVATPFGPNGIKPFNAFLQQQTKLNNDGEMFSPAADAHIVPDSEALKIHCDSITIDVTFTNTGTEPLYAPYGLTMYKDQLQGSIIYQNTYNADLEVKDTIHLHLKYAEEDLAQWNPVSEFIIAINDMGHGIAEAGEQQRECDTTDNTLLMPFTGFIHTEYDTVTHHMCVGETYEIGTSIYTEDGIYVDTLINRNGCDSIVTSYVYTHSISVDLGDDQTYCARDYVPVTLDAGNGAIVPSNYEWQDGSSNRTYTVFDDGLYSVKVYDEYNCVDSDSVRITIIPNPEVFITKNHEDFCGEGSVILTANSTIPEVDYLWNTNESTQSITVVYHGTYTVVADNEGCSGTASIQIPICPCEVWVPSAFTPNSDGVNDVFQPQISNTLAEYHLYIYDRWGEQIFYTDDPNAYWDGTYKDKRVTTNVFNYVIFYSCSSSPKKKLEKHGTITIIR